MIDCSVKCRKSLARRSRAAQRARARVVAKEAPWIVRRPRSQATFKRLPAVVPPCCQYPANPNDSKLQAARGRRSSTLDSVPLNASAVPSRGTPRHPIAVAASADDGTVRRPRIPKHRGVRGCRSIDRIPMTSRRPNRGRPWTDGIPCPSSGARAPLGLADGLVWQSVGSKAVQSQATA